MLLTLLPLLILLLPPSPSPSPSVKRRRSDDPQIPPLPYISNERGHDDDESSIDSLVDSVILQCVSDGDLDILPGTIEKLNVELNVEEALMNLLDQRKKRVHNNLYNLRKMYPRLSLEKLKVYCVPLNWSSMKRVNFLCDLSDNLSGGAEKELQSKSQLIFGKDWNHRVQDWIDSIAQEYRPWECEYQSVKRLLRFVRNRRHHRDKFQESRGLRSMRCFDQYFHERFPHLLVESYIAAHHFCGEELWFKEEYCPRKTC